MAERGTPLAAASQSSRPQAASSPCGAIQSAASLLPRQPGSGHRRSRCADDRRACHAARGSVRAPQCELLAAVPATRGTAPPALFAADSSHLLSALQARCDQAARDGRSPVLRGELRGGRWGSLRSAAPALWARPRRRASLCASWRAALGTGVRSWFRGGDRSQGLGSEFGSEFHVGNPPCASESVGGSVWGSGFLVLGPISCLESASGLSRGSDGQRPWPGGRSRAPPPQGCWCGARGRTRVWRPPRASRSWFRGGDRSLGCSPPRGFEPGWESRIRASVWNPSWIEFRVGSLSRASASWF